MEEKRNGAGFARAVFHWRLAPRCGGGTNSCPRRRFLPRRPPSSLATPNRHSGVVRSLRRRAGLVGPGRRNLVLDKVSAVRVYDGGNAHGLLARVFSSDRYTHTGSGRAEKITPTLKHS